MFSIYIISVLSSLLSFSGLINPLFSREGTVMAYILVLSFKSLLTVGCLFNFMDV